MPRSTKGRAAARGLDARLSLQHASCLLEMLHSKQLRSIKMLLDSNHGIYRNHCLIATLLVARTEPSPLVSAELANITESFYDARARNRASSASSSAMRRSRATSAAASKRCGICCEQFASHAETAKMITRSGRAL